MKCSLCNMEIDKWKVSRHYPRLDLDFCYYCITDDALAVKGMVARALREMEGEL